ncbi:hypothetical protein D3C87_1793440 [compost metagenome]
MSEHPTEFLVGFDGKAAVLTAVFLDVQLTLRQGRTVHVAQETCQFLVVAPNGGTVVCQVSHHLVAQALRKLYNFAGIDVTLLGDEHFTF